MYVFQLFAKAINEPRLYIKKILYIEDYILLFNDNIKLVVFDPNISTNEKLIFYIDFIYKNILCDIKIVFNLLPYISINVEIQKDRNFINDEVIRYEVTEVFYEVLRSKI